LAANFENIFSVREGKVTQLWVLEQRGVIRLLLKDGVAPKDIPACLSKVYEKEAMKKTEVFYRAKEIRT
jgi:hypothetical protein